MSIRKHKTPRSFVNQSFAIPDDVAEKNERKLGKLYNSIDFENFDFDMKNPPRGATVIGQLQVGHHKIDLSISECNRIISTLHDAMDIANKRYRIG